MTTLRSFPSPASQACHTWSRRQATQLPHAANGPIVTGRARATRVTVAGAGVPSVPMIPTSSRARRSPTEVRRKGGRQGQAHRPSANPAALPGIRCSLPVPDGSALGILRDRAVVSYTPHAANRGASAHARK